MYKDPYIRNEHGTDVTHNTVAHSRVFNQDMHEKRIHACLADSIFHVTKVAILVKFCVSFKR